jgi:hypothetical protein
MNGAIANSDYPGLGIGQPLSQFSRSGHCVLSDLKFSRFNVDRHNFPMAAWLDLWANLSLINLIAPPSKLFFTVSRLSDRHWLKFLRNK